MLLVPIVTILVRDMRLKFFQTYLVPISRLVALTPSLLGLLKKFNRVSRTNVVTSGIRNISKACSKLQSHISRKYHDKRYSQNLNNLPRANIVTGDTCTISWRIVQKKKKTKYFQLLVSQHKIVTNVIRLRSIFAIACKASFSCHSNSTHVIANIMQLRSFAIPWVAMFTGRLSFLCDWGHSQCHE